jgi:hypothetical protein
MPRSSSDPCPLDRLVGPLRARRWCSRSASRRLGSARRGALAARLESGRQVAASTPSARLRAVEARRREVGRRLRARSAGRISRARVGARARSARGSAARRGRVCRAPACCARWLAGTVTGRIIGTSFASISGRCGGVLVDEPHELVGQVVAAEVVVAVHLQGLDHGGAAVVDLLLGRRRAEAAAGDVERAAAEVEHGEAQLAVRSTSGPRRVRGRARGTPRRRTPRARSPASRRAARRRGCPRAWPGGCPS